MANLIQISKSDLGKIYNIRWYFINYSQNKHLRCNVFFGSDGDCFVFALGSTDNVLDVIFIDFDVILDRPTCKSAVCGLCFPFEGFIVDDVFCCWEDEGWLRLVPLSFPPPLLLINLLELFDRLRTPCLESVPKIKGLSRYWVLYPSSRQIHEITNTLFKQALVLGLKFHN